MKISDIVQDVTIRARSEGVEAAASATRNLAVAGDAVVATAGRVERTTLDMGRAYERLQRDIDAAYRQQQAFERGQRTLERALGANRISTEAYDRSMALLTAKYGPASLAADRFGASVKASSGNVGGIAAQFQDVVVQLAGGQSPFLIALQQGTQLSGQLEQTGGGVRALGQAFLSLVSPLSLATLGGIAGFGLLVQYLTSAGEKVETLDDRLQAHADVIGKIKEAYGEAAEGLDKYASESQRVLETQLRAATQKLKADLADLASTLANSATKVQPQISMEFGLPSDLAPVVAEATTKFKAFNDALVTLRNGAAAGAPNIAAFRDEVARVAAATNDPGVQRLAGELLGMSEAAFKAEQALGGSARAIKVMSDAANSGLVALNGYNAALRSLQMGVPELAKVLTAQTEMAEARKKLDEGIAAAQKAGGTGFRTEATATEAYTRRVRDLNDVFQQRVRTITGVNDLEKEFAKTIQDKTIAGLEGEAKGIAQARADYEQRNRDIEERIKLGASEADATSLRAQSEKALALELKNVAAANKAKAASGGSSSTGSDAFDNALQRSRDTIEELRQQQEQASKTTVEVYRLTEANKLRRAAASAGRSDEAGITDAINAQAEAYARQRKATEDAIEVQKRYRDSVKFTADIVTSFAEDVLTGSLESALKSLGKSFLSNSLDALISGKGPLAGMTGLAANDNKSQGGLIGLLTGNNLKPLTDAVAKGAEKGSQAGTVDGVVTGLGTFGGSGNGILGIDGKQLAGGLTAIAGLAGAYGAGASAGSMGQAAFGGAISGGAGGLALASSGLISGSLGSAAVLGPLGAALGIGLAVYGNQQAKKQQKEQRRLEAENNYRNAQADIASFRSQARGEPQDTLATRIRDAETSARKLADVAFLAGKAAEANAIWADGQIYIARAIGEYKDGFSGLLDSLNSGLGPSSPFATAKASIKDFGDELEAFVANTARAFGDDAGQVAEARAAAASYALTVLDGAKSLSTVGTRMQEIQGTAAGLGKVLTDLGWSAEQAGAAVSSGVSAALARLRESFEADLAARTNDARGAGYLNDLTGLVAELATLRADAAALGTDQGAVTAYFSAAAQDIVNGANLTGDAFYRLLGQFPDLIGVVREAGVTIDATTRAVEAASRRLGYQDRIFNALNDTGSLSGQLEAFDRAAQREREAEIRAGGDAINDLEGALAAERLKIIEDFADQAAEEQRRALDEARNFFDTFSRNLRQFVDGLRSGSDSPLSPQARLAAAQQQYDAQLALAQGGDRDAVNGLTNYASALIDAAKGFYASSAGYQTVFETVTAQLLALPTQVSAEQFIVDAIEQSRDALLDSLDANGDGMISLQEATNTALASIFHELDLNGDGQLSKLELIRGTTRATADSTEYQNAILAQTNGLVGASNSLLSSANAIAAAQEALLSQIRSLNSTQQQTLDALRGQFGLNQTVGINGLTLSNNMVEALNKIVYNTAQTVDSLGKGGGRAYASGGWITGGIPGRDSVRLASGDLGMPGEFIIREPVAQANAAWLPDFNRTGRLPAMPSGALSPGMVMPRAANDHDGGRAIVAELRRLNDRIALLEERLVAAEYGAAEGVRAGVDDVARETRAARADARQSRNDPRNRAA